MTLALNGTTATAVYLNGTEIDKAYLNGTEVYSAFGTHQITVAFVSGLSAYSFNNYFSPFNQGNLSPTTVTGVATKTLSALFAHGTNAEVYCRATDDSLCGLNIKIPDGTNQTITANSFRSINSAIASYIRSNNGATVPLELSITSAG